MDDTFDSKLSSEAVNILLKLNKRKTEEFNKRKTNFKKKMTWCEVCNMNIGSNNISRHRNSIKHKANIINNITANIGCSSIQLNLLIYINQ